MALKRKCQQCDTWNDGAADYCIHCGNVLSPALIEAERERQREERRRNEPKTPLDLFLESWEKSRFLLLRILYKIVYTITAIVMGIAFFFAYITIGSNG